MIKERIQTKIDKLTKELKENENIIKQRTLEINSHQIMNKREYTLAERKLQYQSMLALAEKYVNLEENAEFQQHIMKVENALRALKSGEKGEKKVQVAMDLLGPKIKILRNLHLKYEGLDIEHDLVIICKTGIFSIEVKHWKNNATLNKHGYLVSKGKNVNLIEQIRRHENSLKRLLEDNISLINLERDHLDVHSIILWANDNSHIQNNFKKVPVCYVNELEYEILNSTKYTHLLSKEEIQHIYNELKVLSRSERKYPLEISSDFLEDLINISNKLELEKCEKLRAKIDKLTYQQEHPVASSLKTTGKIVGYAATGTAAVAGAAIITVASLIVDDMKNN